MEFQSLAESPLGVTDEELAALFTPFVRDTVSGDNPEWRGEIARRKKKVLRKYLKQRLFGWLPSHQRNEAAIIAEYSRAWQESQYAAYTLARPPTRISPWVWRGQRTRQHRHHGDQLSGKKAGQHLHHQAQRARARGGALITHGS